MSYPRPFSPEEPCLTCGAGMSHRPDEHEDWCAWVAEANRRPILWEPQITEALRKMAGRRSGFARDHVRTGVRQNP